MNPDAEMYQEEGICVNCGAETYESTNRHGKPRTKCPECGWGWTHS